MSHSRRKFEEDVSESILTLFSSFIPSISLKSRVNTDMAIGMFNRREDHSAAHWDRAEAGDNIIVKRKRLLFKGTKSLLSRLCAVIIASQAGYESKSDRLSRQMS